MEDNFQKWVLKRTPTGPLVQYLNAFMSCLFEQRYTRYYIGLQCRTVANFSQWLLKNKISESNITEKHVEQYLKRGNHRTMRRSGIFATFRRLTEFMKQVGIIKKSDKPIPQTPIQQTLAAFAQYILNEKGLSERTLILYSPFIEKFLEKQFGRGVIQLDSLSAKNIINFIEYQAKTFRIGRAKIAVNAIRAFLRYVIFCGYVDSTLIYAVPSVAAWSLTGIPRAISQEHIQAVLAHCPRNSKLGKRDYAILMLLIHLGLRASEIIRLTLDSIDWENGRILVNGKAGKNYWLPLPTVVGESIVDYLQFGRPQCKIRTLFLRTLAPLNALGGQAAVAHITDRAIKRAGVEPPSHGAHQFRHALASRLLNQGASLREIGEILEHQDVKTTSIYAKVDLTNLRSLSMPWLGDVK